MTDENVTVNPAGNARLVAGNDELNRVSLAPLDGETALKALLATPPSDDQD